MGNIFVESPHFTRFIEEHIPEIQKRNSPKHWDALSLTNPESFKQNWKPRQGPLNLVKDLLAERKERFNIVCLSDGLGDFSTSLAQCLTEYKNEGLVWSVDFSKVMSQHAKTLAAENGISHKMRFFTKSNLDFLRNCVRINQKFSMIFCYGGLVENTPLADDIKKTLILAEESLENDGLLWLVASVRTDDNIVQDISGEYSYPVKTVTKIIKDLGLNIVKSTIGPRPDKHSLIPGGPEKEHMHKILRILLAKGSIEKVPDFSFK